MKKYNFESLTPEERQKLEEYVNSVKEIKKEIKKLIRKAEGKTLEKEGGNMSSGLTLSTK